MTQPTHDEVIAWIDERVMWIDKHDEYEALLGESRKKEYRLLRASLLANRDVLERHKPELDGYGVICCSECISEMGEGLNQVFPCPTYLYIYNRIREVM